MELRRDANNWLLVLVSSSMLLRCLCRRQGKERVQEDTEVKQECDLRDHGRLRSTSYTSVLHVPKARMLHFYTPAPKRC